MRLEKFLFFKTLEKGGLAIGFFGVFVWGSMLLTLVGFSAKSFVSSWSNDSFKEFFDPDTLKIILPTIIVSALFYINVSLIKGIKNKQHNKMTSWLLAHGTYIVISVLVTYILFGGHPAFFGPPVFVAPLEFFVAYIAALAFYIYCFMAVYSLYENIREESQRGHVNNVLTEDFLMPKDGAEKNFDYMKLV